MNSFRSFLLPFAVLSTGIVGVPMLIGVATHPGPALAARIPHPGHRPVVQWVFREADLVSCRTPAYTLRHLQSRFGDAVDVVAIGVDVDEAWGRSFLRNQRLSAEFVSVTDTEYRKRFHTPLATGLYVLLDGNIVQAFPSGKGRTYSDFDPVGESVEALLLSQTTAGTPSATPSPNSRRQS